MYIAIISGTDLTIIGTIIAAIITAIAGLWQYRKTRFTDSVIKSRKEYLISFREESARFCILTDKIINRRCMVDVNNQLESAYRLKLMLNPFDYVYWWDGEIIKMIDDLISNPQKNKLQKLTAYLQASCILEWKGITKEGINGIQKKKSKDKLRRDYYNKYVLYCKNKGIYE